MEPLISTALKLLCENLITVPTLRFLLYSFKVCQDDDFVLLIVNIVRGMTQIFQGHIFTGVKTSLSKYTIQQNEQLFLSFKNW
jgi:hypothetical protein